MESTTIKFFEHESNIKVKMKLTRYTQPIGVLDCQKSVACI